MCRHIAMRFVSSFKLKTYVSSPSQCLCQYSCVSVVGCVSVHHSLRVDALHYITCNNTFLNRRVSSRIHVVCTVNLSDTARYSRAIYKHRVSDCFSVCMSVILYSSLSLCLALSVPLPLAMFSVVRAWVRACVHACVRACMRACVYMLMYM